MTPARTMPLVAREEDLRVLDQARERSARGHIAVVVLSGPAGVGKSRLLEEAATRARASGFHVLEATASPLHTGLDLGVLVDVLRPLVRPEKASSATFGPPALVAGLSALSVLFDGLGLSAPAALGDPSLERTRLFEAIRELIARAARDAPLMLVVDDAHWSDTASVTLLAYCIRGLRSSRLSVLLARRSGEGRGDVENMVAALRPPDGLVEWDVPPLDDDAVRSLTAHLLPGEPPAALLALLSERAAGVPLFVDGIVGVLRRQGQLTRVGDRWVLGPVRHVTLPPEIRDLVRRQLGYLDPMARVIVDVVAVGGGVVSDPILSAIVPASVSGLDSVLTLVEAGLLVEETRGGSISYRVSHPLLAEVAYDALPEVRRRHLHAAYLRALQQGHSPNIGLVAHHMMGAGDRVPAGEALPVVEAALRKALAARAGDAAVRAADAALGLAVRLDQPEIVPRLQAQRATGLEVSGRTREAATAWREVAERASGAGALVEAARAWHRLATIEWDVGRFQSALEHIEESLGILATAARNIRPGSVDQEDARITVEKERVAVLTTRLRLVQRTQGDVATAAAELEVSAAQVGSAEGRARAALARGRLAMHSGTLRESEHFLEAAAALADEAGDAVLAHEVARARMSVGLERGDHARTLVTAQRALLEARKRGLPAIEASYLESAAFAEVQAGSWEDAARDADGLLELGERLGSARVRASALAIRALLYALRGDLRAASAFIDRIRAAYGDGVDDDRHLFAKVDLLDNLVDLARSRPSAVVARVERTGSRAPVMLSFATLLAAQAHSQVGRTEDALRLAEMLRDFAEPGTFPSALARQVEGFVERSRGNRSAARATFREAAAALDSLALPYHAAVAWLDWSEMAGTDDDVDHVVHERLDVLAALGARLEVERARRILRNKVVRPPRHRSPDRPALTVRELEVAHLVAEGLANAEIADRLHISTRTVTTHLQHVYTRLDISSRTALTRYVLTQPPRGPAEDA